MWQLNTFKINFMIVIAISFFHLENFTWWDLIIDFSGAFFASLLVVKAFGMCKGFAICFDFVFLGRWRMNDKSVLGPEKRNFHSNYTNDKIKFSLLLAPIVSSSPF